MNQQRLYKYLFVLFAVAIVVITQIFSQYLVERHMFKIDITENELYRLSSSTYEIIDSLSEPVEITVLSSESDYVFMLREILKRYENAGCNVRLKFIDPYSNPVLVDQLRDRGIHVQENDIVVEGKYGIQSFSIDDMYIFNAGKTEIEGLNAEQKLSSALLSVSTEKDYTAGFIDGHNERPSESLLNLFRQNSFNISRGMPGSVLEQKPDLVIIASPDRDYRVEEINLLETYLNGGGSLLVFVEPSLRDLTNLDLFLSRWGIIPGDRVVFEKEAFTGNNPINIVPMYGPHEINRYFMDTRIFITMPSSRNLNLNPDTGSAYKVDPVLVSTADSYGKAGYQFNRSARTPQDLSGPFYLALSSVKEVVRNGQASTSRLLVVGSRKIYADDLLGFSSYGNAAFISQTINWLTERVDTLNIPPKNIHPAPLSIIRKQALLYGMVISLLVPFLILGFGLTVFFRRKRMK